MLVPTLVPTIMLVLIQVGQDGYRWSGNKKPLKIRGLMLVYGSLKQKFGGDGGIW